MQHDKALVCTRNAEINQLPRRATAAALQPSQWPRLNKPAAVDAAWARSGRWSHKCLTRRLLANLYNGNIYLWNHSDQVLLSILPAFRKLGRL